MAKKSTSKQQFALCISRKEPDLEFRKVYRILPDESAEKSKYVRVIDESGEDYLSIPPAISWRWSCQRKPDARTSGP